MFEALMKPMQILDISNLKGGSSFMTSEWWWGKADRDDSSRGSSSCFRRTNARRSGCATVTD